jgi:oligopeptide transport system substrate-binding protein
MLRFINNFVFFIAIILSICIIGCQGVNKEKPIKTITLNLQEGDPPSLNPYAGIDLRSRCIALTLFEPLMRRNKDGTLQPAAAKSVEIDPTHTVYTFQMRPHCWSNGTLVTSYDFERTWKYALMPHSSCFRADLFYPIKNAMQVKKGELPLDSLGINTPDPFTLVVTLEHPTPYFLDLTATSFFLPLRVASDEEPLQFNGPFLVKQRTPDQLLIFEKNPYYWDRDSIEIEQICFTMVRDPMTAYAMFEKGELDLVGDPFSPLPFDLIPTLEKNGSLQKKTISRIFYLLLNTENAPLNVKPLRKALSLSIDRKELTEHLFFGELPTISPLPTTLSYMERQSYEEHEDVLALLQEALDEMEITMDQFPKMVLSYAELSGQKKLAEFIQAQWKQKLGIDIDLMCQEWNIHASRLRKGTYQIGTLHLTTLYQDPMFYFDLFRSKQSLCNYCRWESATFQKLLEESEKTCDPQERDSYMQKAEQYLLEEMPVITLFTQNLQFLMRDDIDLKISELGIYDFKNAHLR